ncbi:MAG: metalloregulator ArsR/SmtB family transcription factor [Sphingomonadales bacterium]|nr:metalloregulator ArsR/SmtB family transcription factor [Sphingomonadales bacterium]
MEKVFQALAAKPRRDILAFLARSDLTAGELADRFDISKPALSKHLSVLDNAGLVWRERRGQFVHYGLKQGVLKQHFKRFLKQVPDAPDSPGKKKKSAKKKKP